MLLRCAARNNLLGRLLVSNIKNIKN